MTSISKIVDFGPVLGPISQNTISTLISLFLEKRRAANIEEHQNMPLWFLTLGHDSLGRKNIEGGYFVMFFFSSLVVFLLNMN